MTLQDIVVDKLTYDLLYQNGRLDAKRFKKTNKYEHDMYNSWREIAQQCGYDPNARTPAREAYEDGWYSPD